MNERADEPEDERNASDRCADGSLKNAYQIRILSDGRVVFGDLPKGLWEVAQVVAGFDAGQPSVTLAASPGEDPSP